jgi:hypothetical protein
MLGALPAPTTNILGASLAPIGPSGHHVLGGLLLRARCLLLLGPFHLLLPLLPHQPNDPFCQGFIVLDFLVEFFFLILGPSHLTFESAYQCIHLLIKLEISKNRSINHDIPFRRGSVPPPPLPPTAPA